MLPRGVITAVLSSSIVAVVGCSGTIYVDTSKLPDSYQCDHMEEVCKESREFERTYEKLAPDEKKDAETVLKAYRLQCTGALEMCRKSGSKKKK